MKKNNEEYTTKKIYCMHWGQHPFKIELLNSQQNTKVRTNVFLLNSKRN